MNPNEQLAETLQGFWGGQTLASLCDEALKELNGTHFTALRAGPRVVIIVCLTGEHEMKKLEKQELFNETDFGKWSEVSLFEAWVRAISKGGFCYSRRDKGDVSSPVVLIAAEPRSITIVERLLNLGP